jgi:flagellin
MPLVINSSTKHLKALRSLNNTERTLSDTLRRISSGLRVESASDDPGHIGSIALAESKARGLRQSIKNLNDGLSLSQTLEGGLSQIEAALMRMRELSVQASNDTYNQSDRETIQAEVIQLTKLIDEVADGTQFNKIGLLSGVVNSVDIFVEGSQGVKEKFGIDLVHIDTHEGGRSAQYSSARRGVYLDDLADNQVEINGVGIRGTVESDDTVSFSYSSGSAIAKAKAINSVSDTTGVTARAGETRVVANRAPSHFSLDDTSYFSLNGSKISGFDIVDFDSDGALFARLTLFMNRQALWPRWTVMDCSH